MYSATVARAFETVHRYTKAEDCDCPNIGACDHGLVTFNDVDKTNALKVRKTEFHDRIAAVESAATVGDPPDDSVSPAPGPDEGADRTEIEADIDADGGVYSAENGDGSNIVVSSGSGSMLGPQARSED